MNNKARQDLMELIDTLTDEDVKKVYQFLFGIFYSKDDNTYYYGRKGELWQARII